MRSNRIRSSLPLVQSEASQGSAPSFAALLVVGERIWIAPSTRRYGIDAALIIRTFPFFSLAHFRSVPATWACPGHERFRALLRRGKLCRLFNTDVSCCRARVARAADETPALKPNEEA